MDDEPFCAEARTRIVRAFLLPSISSFTHNRGRRPELPIPRAGFWPSVGFGLIVLSH